MEVILDQRTSALNLRPCENKLCDNMTSGPAWYCADCRGKKYPKNCFDPHDKKEYSWTYHLSLNKMMTKTRYL